jgi:prepilin-type N-terminal cleavage/methylation domain-containing protein
MRARKTLDRDRRFRRLRSGFSLTELTVTVLIVSIIMASTIPSWARIVLEMRATSAAMALASDMQALRRQASRTGQSIVLTITAGTSHMEVSPPQPNLIGDSSGIVDYSRRYPGIVFQSAGFDGEDSAELTMWGDIVSTTNGQPLGNAQASISIGPGGPVVDVDILDSLTLGAAL